MTIGDVTKLSTSRGRRAAQTIPAQRDLALDAARVACLIAVVVLHILLVTLTTDPSTGALRSVMAPTEASWYAPVSWLVQVMPLFFVVGGCASAISWSRQSAEGVRGPAWVRARLLRLVVPASAVWVALALAGALATLVGMPADWASMALQGLGMHLWFVGAYSACLVGVPLLHGLHDRRPVLTLAALVGLSAAIEVLRIAAERPWWGLLGFAPVWLAIHQIGFFRHDGSFARASAGRLLGITALSVLVMLCLTSLPWWGADGLSALNPPTLCMIALGAAQACVLQLCSPALERLMRWRPAQAVAWVVGSRATTLYLWHLPVIVAVMAVWWLLGGPDPVPGSAQWWLWRLPIGLLCWAMVLLVVRPLGVLEAVAGRIVAREPEPEGPAAGGSPSGERPSTAPRADGSAPLRASSPDRSSSPDGRAWVRILAAAVLVFSAAVLEVRFLLGIPLALGGAAAMVAAVLLLVPPARRS